MLAILGISIFLRFSNKLKHSKTLFFCPSAHSQRDQKNVEKSGVKKGLKQMANGKRSKIIKFIKNIFAVRPRNVKRGRGRGSDTAREQGEKKLVQRGV